MKILQVNYLRHCRRESRHGQIINIDPVKLGIASNLLCALKPKKKKRKQIVIRIKIFYFIFFFSFFPDEN